MKKVIFGILIAITVLLFYKQCVQSKNQTVFKENSVLIQESIENVGKLVVTEGQFSEVFSYENSKAIFGDYFSSDKKALVVANANASIAYDLSKIEYNVDEVDKVLSIISVPKEELTINTDLEYFDVQSGFLNPFEAKDYNTIKENVNKRLKEKIEASTLKTNAKNRLISELSKFYILTNSMGWTLQYNQTPIDKLSEFQNIKL